MSKHRVSGAVVALLWLFLGTAQAGAFEVSEGQVEVTGGSLFYRSAGSGPVVVLLHGYLKSSTDWEPYLPGFPRGYRIIAFDLPGHGHSDFLGATFTHRGAAASLLEALDAMGIPSFDVVGHSSGALIALRMALQQPHRISSIVAISTPWRVPAALRERVSTITMETAPAPMLEMMRTLHTGGSAQIRWLIEQQRRIAADPHEMALTDDQLGALAVETLVVHGDRDALLPVAGARELATRLLEASLLVLPGRGHELPLDSGQASDLLLTAISEFLGKRGSAGATRPVPHQQRAFGHNE